jgi:hypothetical protein
MPGSTASRTCQPAHSMLLWQWVAQLSTLHESFVPGMLCCDTCLALSFTLTRRSLSRFRSRALLLSLFCTLGMLRFVLCDSITFPMCWLLLACRELQAVAASALAELMASCTSRQPCPNDKLVKNLCAMACGDSCETPCAAAAEGLRYKPRPAAACRNCLQDSYLFFVFNVAIALHYLVSGVCWSYMCTASLCLAAVCILVVGCASDTHRATCNCCCCVYVQFGRGCCSSAAAIPFTSQRHRCSRSA